MAVKWWVGESGIPLAPWRAATRETTASRALKAIAEEEAG